MTPRFRARLCFPVLTLLLFVSVANPLEAQNRVRFSNFAAQIPESHTEVIAINNLAGHIESAIENRALARVVEEGSIADFARMIMAPPLDMDQARDWMADFGNYIPSTIAVSAEDEIYPFSVNVLEGLWRLNLAEKTFHVDEYDEQELAKLEEETLTILEGLELPDICIWVEWEERFTGEEIFDAFKTQASFIGQVTDLKYTDGRDSFEVSGLLEDLIDPQEVALFFQFMGFDDENGALALAALDFKIYFKAEWVDDGMRITLGSNSDDQPRAGEIDGLRDGDAEIAFSNWNGTRMRESFEKLEQSMDRWAETGIGRMFRADDREDLWRTYRQMIDQSRLFAADGTMRCWHEGNRVLAGIRETGMPQVDSVLTAEIASAIPADAESYAFSSERSMADFLSAWITYYEDRAATRMLQRDIQGEVDEAIMIEQMTFAYYEHFGPMREAIMNDLVDVEALPFGVLMDTQGRIDTLNIDADFMDEPVQMELDRFPRLVAVSQTSQPELLKERMLAAFDRFVEGVFSASGSSRPDYLSFVEELELGEGVTGHELTLSWLDDSGLGAAKLKGDMRPHVFQHGNLVYFSTSVKLSRQLLGATSGVSAPRLEEGQSLVNFGRFRGITFGNMLRTLFNFISAFTMGGGNAFEEQMVMSIGNGFAEFTGILNHVEWASRQKGDVRETEYIFDFQNE